MKRESPEYELERIEIIFIDWPEPEIKIILWIR